MNKKLSLFLIILLFILGLILRFYKLGQVPPALDWDEASLGYNTYTLLNTGKDEYGNSWPLSIRSFNDYKAPLYVYLSLFPIKIFGLNEFSVRFISAFFGSLTIIITYLLFKKISQQEILGLLTALFLAISPWHLQFSRVAFEANLSLFLFLGAIYLLVLSFKKNLFLPLSILLFGLSLFAYHSPKIIVPIFLLGILLRYNNFFKQRKYLFSSLIIALIFLILLIYSVKLGGASRFFSTTSLKEQNHYFKIIKNILSSYLSHYDINFLFITGDPQTRHHPPALAQLYLWELPFVIAGIVFLFKNKFKFNFLIFWWFLIAPTASALTKDTPNAVRALFFLPVFQFFTSYGLISLFQIIKKNFLKISFIFLNFVFCFLSFFYYLHMYYFHGPIEDSQAWLYGYKELVMYINQNREKYQKIIVTTAYDQPYIYFLFYTRFPKIIFNNGEFYKGFANLEFRPIDWDKDNKLNGVLLIGTGDEIPNNSDVVKEINFLNGKNAFKIVSL